VIIINKKTKEAIALGAPQMGRALVHPARPCLVLKETETSQIESQKRKPTCG
jgi:hypothetical protein